MALAGPDVKLTDDQIALIDAVRDFARGELLPLDRKWDEDESSVAEVLPQLAEMGLMNLVIPEDYGGLGCDYCTYASIIHEIAYASPSAAVTLSVHNMVGKILAANSNNDEKIQWVREWGTPGSFAAFALSEANAGSDAAAVSTKIVEDDEGFWLTGEKMWITNGMHARWFLTLGRLEGAPKGEDLVAIWVDGNESGISRDKICGKMGIRGSETAVIAFDNVFAPKANLIGERGDGLKVFLSTLNEGRIGIAAQACGIAEAAFDEMVSYAKQREQFGKPIGKFQSISNMVADSAVELAAAKLLIWEAAMGVDEKRLAPLAASMAKLYATEAANTIADRAVQIHGGSGYVREFRVEQLYRDARVTTIYEGTSEVQRIVIAREYLGRL